MAQYAGNDAYLEIDTNDVSGYWTGEVDFEQTADTKEANYGAGEDYTRRVGGLVDTTMTFVIVYDDTTVGKAASFDLVKPNQVIDLVYGPEGQTTGKPKHAGKFIVQNKVGPSVAQEKERVTVELSVEQYAPPTSDMNDGGTF